jgi:hypothetical protein
VGVAVVVYFALQCWDLGRDYRVDPSAEGEPGVVVLSWLMLAVVVGAGVWAVWLLGQGKWVEATVIGLGAVGVVVLASGEQISLAQARQCDCAVSERDGTAQAIWLAFDTIPILDINETVGWEEPHPATASWEDWRRWFPALAVRYAVGVILLAFAKGVFDVVGKPWSHT